ncbi:hypothetical protein CONLIGDRAFT_638732 [Coniochaeta ligniaria NRRL 30616]|uniref:Uncharacterized protein n=1 Tax=Coniochaeta ligniaria NRRL 30616 TaxID=1408157 RepID=A0A1J7JWC8_9PEZI|nr:hypothetical protein CONLIGDRAFT_638732 [Coniochaeta ligniaria NRRL 30616]
MPETSATHTSPGDVLTFLGAYSTIILLDDIDNRYVLLPLCLVHISSEQLGDASLIPKPQGPPSGVLPPVFPSYRTITSHHPHRPPQNLNWSRYVTTWYTSEDIEGGTCSGAHADTDQGLKTTAPNKDEGPSMLHNQKDLLVFLMADPPTKTSDDKETDTTADKDEDPSMLRNKSIAALKQQLSALHIAEDDELFKASSLNVGKYILGPIPEARASTKSDNSAVMACQANEVSDEQSIAAAEDIATSGKLLEAENLAIPTLTDSKCTRTSMPPCTHTCTGTGACRT